MKITVKIGAGPEIVHEVDRSSADADGFVVVTIDRARSAGEKYEIPLDRRYPVRTETWSPGASAPSGFELDLRLKALEAKEAERGAA